MILVADSGSTKTEWALAEDPEHVDFLVKDRAGWLKHIRPYLIDETYDEFLEKLKVRTLALKLGDGLVKGNDVGPVIHENALMSIDNYVKTAIKEGGKLICGGERANEGDLAKGSFYKPTIIADVLPEHTIFKEEIFGPVLAVIKADSYEHAIELQNNCNYGLSSSIYTKNVNI